MKCQECKEESDDIVSVKVGRKKRKLCPECLEIMQEEEEIAAEAEGAMKEMMEYKGR